MTLYRLKNKVKQIRKVLRWIPIIWNDRDWDQYYIYEVLKQKLIDQEKGIRNGYCESAESTADNILKAIEMIDIVQNEKHIDDYLSTSENTIYKKEELHAALDKHDKARQELFNYLNDNIDEWWD